MALAAPATLTAVGGGGKGRLLGGGCLWTVAALLCPFLGQRGAKLSGFDVVLSDIGRQTGLVESWHKTLQPRQVYNVIMQYTVSKHLP